MSSSLPPRLCSSPGSSVHGILQARILGWVAIPFSREFSQPRDWTQVSCIAGGFFSVWATRELSHLKKKKKRANAICSNVDGPRDYHTQWIKSERERQILYHITYMWNVNYGTSEPIYKTETNSQRSDLWLPRGSGGREKEGLGVWGW